MIKNAAVYLPCNPPKLSKVIDGVASDGGLLRTPTYYEFTAGAVHVRLNVMPQERTAGHLQGFLGYLESLRGVDGDERVDAAQALVRQARTVLGVVVDREFDFDSEAWASIQAIVAKFAGCAFVLDSVVRGDGAVLCGPLARYE